VRRWGGDPQRRLLITEGESLRNRVMMNYSEALKSKNDWVRVGPPRIHPDVRDLLDQWVELAKEEARATGAKAHKICRDDALMYAFYHGIEGLKHDIQIMKESKQVREARVESRGLVNQQ